ncbi:hypothetical protein WSM22_11020 [Cytophagales bacterium WSM2-2]|nr:hypothetical protein WSM22_11020 [Cytophagales bacterium WSM2-2]
MCAKKFIFFFAIIVAVNNVNAQFSLPRIDVEAKLTQNVVPGGDREDGTLKAMETSNLQLGAHWQINQNIALGWVYSTSLRGNGYNAKDFNFNFGGGDTKALTSYSCADLRLSTGRAARWRPYISLQYGRVEIIEDRGSFRLASKQNAFGGSLGIMRRMGNRLYWNVFEASARSFSKIYWADCNFMLEVKTGFTYNIGKRK